MSKPVEFNEIYSGMKLWNNRDKKWAKVLRVSLWKTILEQNPGVFYKTKQKG